MLETLDTIPWSELEHAYGSAEEVPAVLRALASPEPEVYEGALAHLWYTVIHQGTVYSATAYIVPFFCELLDAPEIQNKAALLDYLATIACGASYADVHVREKERRETPAMQMQIAEELRWVSAARDAVSNGSTTYLRLLSSDDATIRAHAAYTLSRCQSHMAEVVPVMQRHYATESVPVVQACLLLSLGLLLPKEEETSLFFLRLLQGTPVALIKIAAAMGCAFAMQEQTNREVLRVLLESYELPEAVKKQFDELPFAEVDLDASVSTALRQIGPSIAPLVVPTLIRAMRRSNALNGLTLVPNLLSFVFEGQKVTRGMSVVDLTKPQVAVLTALAETEALWMLGNMSSLVGNFFDSQWSGSLYSFWERNDVKSFLAGYTVFYD